MIFLFFRFLFQFHCLSDLSHLSFNTFFFLLLLLFIFIFMHFYIHLLELSWITYIFVSSFLHNSSFLHDNQFIRKWSKFDSMGWHKNCLSFQELSNCFLDDKLSNMNINCTKNIVKQNNISIWVKWSCKFNSCLLTSWYIDTFLSNLSFKTFWQHFQVIFKTSIMNHFFNPVFINFRKESYVLLQCLWHDPRFLRWVSYTPSYLYLRLLSYKHFVDDC